MYGTPQLAIGDELNRRPSRVFSATPDDLSAGEQIAEIMG
jgi:hypothetical protein